VVDRRPARSAAWGVVTLVFAPLAGVMANHPPRTWWEWLLTVLFGVIAAIGLYLMFAALKSWPPTEEGEISP